MSMCIMSKQTKRVKARSFRNGVVTLTVFVPAIAIH
jgi:hypothetical protein